MAKSFQDSLTDAQLMLISKAQKSGPDALSDGELQELSSLNRRYAAYQGPEMTTGEAAKTIGKGALNVAGRALDLPGGVVRTAAGLAAEGWTGKNDIITKEDMLNAIVGNAPSTDTLLERSGVGEMGSVDVPWVGPVTGRGTVGFLGDVASGLGAGAGLKAASKGTGLLAKAASVARAPEALIEKGMSAAGTKMYRSGLKGLDRAAELAGKGENSVSNVLMNRGVWGSNKSIQKASDNIIDDLNAKVQKAIEKAAASGKTVSMQKVLAPVRAEAEKIAAAKGTSQFKSQANGFLNQLDDLVMQEKPSKLLPLSDPSPYSVADAQNIKQQIYSQISDPSWQVLARDSQGKKLLKGAARAIKDDIAEQVPEVAAMNAEMAPLLTARKKLAAEVTKEVNRNAIGVVGPMAAVVNPAMAAAKYAADITKMASARTGGGLLLRSPKSQAAVVQALIESTGDRGDQGDMSDNINLVVERIKRKYGIK